MTHNPAAIAEAGERIYREKYRAEYEHAHSGKYAAIDVDSEQIFVAATAEDALNAARRANPAGVFHLIRIGSPGVFRTAYAEASIGDWIFGR